MLVELGFEQKVILATPTTFMSLLKAVAYGWRQEQLADNARQISEQATRIQQTLAVWTRHYSSVGVGLSKALSAYNDLVGSLEKRDSCT